MEGYFTGILDVYKALMTTEETATTPPTYGEPSILAKSIEVTVTPGYREGQLNASNIVVRKEKRINSYTVSMHMDKIPQKILAEVLGRTVDSNGVQIIRVSDKPSNMAIAFACTLDDDTKELWWLYKGKFSEPTKTGKTEGESIEYQTPTIEGLFVRRANDGALSATVETSSELIGDGVEAGWFKKVYETTTV